MDFKYVGYAEDKKIVKGTISASSQAVARELLANQGYRVLDLKVVTAFMPDREKLFPSLFQIKPKVIITFSRQLALLLETGTDIVTSLELLQSQVSNRGFNKVLADVVSGLRGGNQLSAALSKHPEVFPAIYRRALGVGERTGSLEVVLRQAADHMEKEDTAKKKVKNALVYPIFVSITAVVVVAILAFFVLPSFTGLYSSLGVELPLPTRMLLSSVALLNRYGLYLVGALVAVGVLAFVYIKTPAGKYRLHKLALSLLLVGRINLLNELARCCRSMSLLVRAGLPVTEIMSLTIESCGNKAMIEALTGVQQAMFKGEGLSQPMARNPLFLPMMVQMIRVGEQTGNLDVTLLSVAENYEVEAEEKTRAFIAVIQQALTLGIGLAVSFITISLISAMYSIYGQMT